MIRQLSLLIALVLWPLPAFSGEFGEYIGEVETRWETAGGRNMTLLRPLTYIDPKQQQWVAPAGSVIDGASIPQFAWSVIGGPYEGKYRAASVIHDVACVEKSRPWQAVHEVFYWAMRASGVEEWRAKVMYAAVYHFGPRWKRTAVVTGIPVTRFPEALDQAMSRAEAGSRVRILRSFPRATQAIGPLGSPLPEADFQFEILPPANSVTGTQFDQFRKLMEARAETGGTLPNLAQIREFKAFAE